MIKYLIWDFDGVICDSMDMAFEAHNELCIKYSNLPIIKNKEDYSSLINKGYDESLAKYLKKDQINEYLLEHREKMFSKKMKFKVFTETMDYIKENILPSIIITATYEKLVEEVLKNNGYNPEIFKYILGRETEGKKAEKLIQICERLDIQKDEIIYIGDTLSDVQFCDKLEIEIVCVGYGYSPASIFKNNHILKICNTQQELIEFINNINK